MYYVTQLKLEILIHFFKASNLTENQWKLFSFQSFSDNFERMVSPHKVEDFQLIFRGGNLRCLFLLVEMFSLEFVAEFSTLKFF